MSFTFKANPTFGAKNWKAKSNKSELPLYKDKPFHNPVIGSLNTSHRRKQMLYRGFLLSLVLYLVYYIGTLLNEPAHSALSDSPSSWKDRQNEVKQVFVESWNAYEKYAWGMDVYHPISKRGENMGPKPLGWMVVDSLDTLMIMGLDDEIARAKDWVKNELTYDFDYAVNTFETTIRMLGGFLSAYYFSKDDLYLDKATDLGNRLMGAFDSKTGLPYSSVNLKTSQGIKSHVDRGASSTAEVATLQLEFKYLARLTGESLYWEKVEKVMEILDKNQPEDGLVPIYVQPDTGKYQDKLIRLGSRGDSYYEYLLKQYLQTNQQEGIYNKMYREALHGIKKHLVGKSYPNKLTYIGELDGGIGGPLSPKMDHLVCFMGGLLALGATEGLPYSTVKKSGWWSTSQESELSLAKELTETCYRMYHDVETGLSPEIVVFNTDPRQQKDFYIKPYDKHNLQRPETVESLFYLWRITKDPVYRKWGYEIFQSFQKHTKLRTGEGKGETTYVSLDDVTKIPPKKRDNMESFWFAETLKYLYLLFEDDDTVLPLDEVIFNTEAHPFPKFDLEPLFKTGWSREGEAADANSETAGKPQAKQQPVDAGEGRGFTADKEKSTDEEQKANEPKREISSEEQPKAAILADKGDKETIEFESGNLGSTKGSQTNKVKVDVKNIPKAAEPDKPIDMAAEEEMKKTPIKENKIDELLEELEELANGKDEK